MAYFAAFCRQRLMHDGDVERTEKPHRAREFITFYANSLSVAMIRAWDGVEVEQGEVEGERERGGGSGGDAWVRRRRRRVQAAAGVARRLRVWLSSATRVNARRFGLSR